MDDTTACDHRPWVTPVESVPRQLPLGQYAVPEDPVVHLWYFNLATLLQPLAAAMGGLYALILAWDYARDYFELTIPDADVWGVAAIAVAIAGALVVAIPLVVPGIRMAGRIGEQPDEQADS